MFLQVAISDSSQLSPEPKDVFLSPDAADQGVDVICVFEEGEEEGVMEIVPKSWASLDVSSSMDEDLVLSTVWFLVSAMSSVYSSSCVAKET